ncbi:MAG: UDP-N-acetylmuramate dehydrogenase [Flavobacteriales bacterium]|jgi:UDP-N-acetylmuramate dehydrogenase|nr:UDP-N-acetylmuramate dehydrogenase [Flavobacteriales bacterium]|tara:strand:- start:17472 stop:18479 length:1008 start_codon:yes stop_codon:yes gene_type:complete
MSLQENISLRPHNTFGIDVKTKKLATINSVDKLKNILSNNLSPIYILGGGSNILFTKDFDGLILKNELKGIQLISENDNEVYLKVASGEVWHEFVCYCIENNYCGIENLSLIPGSVGASPMQNIGAYGVEVKDFITEVEALHLKSLKITHFSTNDCEFDYRSSIFKTKEKGNYFITAVTFRLNKQPNINTSYGAIQSELEAMGISKPTIKDVSKAVINIRQSKLPDPKEIGNAGSFFKNPSVSNEKAEQLKTAFPEIPNYPQNNGTTKIAAGWLIEQCGYKGKTFGNYGVHKKQALVLVNYSNAKGQEIYDLSSEIINAVNTKFGIELEREVNVL